MKRSVNGDLRHNRETTMFMVNFRAERTVAATQDPALRTVRIKGNQVFILRDHIGRRLLAASEHLDCAG